MSSFTIYTDGSCLNNPGPGGWAAVITDNVTGEREEISGGVKYTTNNRMELMAAISALEKTDEGDSAEIFTDSAYLKKAFNDGWLENWKRNGWITTNKKNVSNQDLWQELDELVSKRDVVFRWVKGHSGTSGNEWCDKLARAAAVNSVIKNSNEDKTETLKLTDSLFGEDFNLPTKYLKIAKKLQMKKYRQEFNFFVAEGLRLCEMALSSTKIEFGFFTEEFLKNERAEELVKKLQVLTKLYKIPSDTFDKISDTQTPQGILLVLRQNLSTPEDVAKKSPIIVLDGVQDPGNVGTILRTAEAFDCAVILLEGSADIYNSKVVRSSMGAIFSLPVALMTREEFLTFAQIKKFEVSATVLDPSAEIYFKHKFKKKSAIVFGSEANGVSEEVSDSAKKIFIPMQGTAESLNVSTAAGIIISEIIRQRS